MRIRATLISLLFAAIAAAGCVTINIYFPAAAAEKAADKIIDDVLDLPRPAGTADKPQSAPPAPGRN